VAQVDRRRPGTRVGVDDRGAELIGIAGQLEQQVMGRLDGLGRPGVHPIDLVDDDDRHQAELERLAQHHPGLRHGAFEGVDEQEAALRHAQNALDLATEVGVPGRIDDVDLDAVVPNRRVLGKDGDPLLSLEHVGIHDQLTHLLVGGEDVRLLQQGVDERGLAMIHVRDDGHVP